MTGRQIPKYIKRLWANLTYTDQIDMHLDRPLVSFTFDDAPRSAFNEAREILEKYNCHGTYYVSLGFLNQDNGITYSSQDLRNAWENGHELACHTKTHIDISKSNIAEFKESVTQNNLQIQKIISGYNFKNFSYPFGSQTVSSKMYLSGLFKSARGNRSGINHGSIDRLNLKTIRLYENLESPDHIQSILNEAVRTNGWIVFYTHGVENGYIEDGCSPAFFENVVKQVKEMNIDIMTVDGAMDLILESRFALTQ